MHKTSFGRGLLKYMQGWEVQNVTEYDKQGVYYIMWYVFRHCIDQQHPFFSGCAAPGCAGVSGVRTTEAEEEGL